MISVIIPAYNEEENIARALESLVKQKYSNKFEVIVVDNNSSDKTAAVARNFRGKLSLKVVMEKRRGRGVAKSKGAAEAKGEILAYLDSDSMAFDNWLSTIDAAFLDKDVSAITGPWRAHDLPPGFTRWFLHTFQEKAQFPYRAIYRHFYLNGMNMAFRRGVYQKAGGFNKKLNVHDDVELSTRIGKIGKIKYVPQMKVNSSGRRFKNGILSGLYSYHKGTLELLLNKNANLKDIR